MVTCRPFRYALATNATTTSFTAQNSTTTEPSGDGVIDLGGDSLSVGNREMVPKYLLLIPFGTAADNKTFDMRVHGYNATVANSALVSTGKIYIPQLLLDVSVVLSAVTFSDHTANTFLADTITVNKGAADNAEWRSLIVGDLTVNSTASVIVHTRGCRYIKFTFDADAGVAPSTNCNCLWRPVDF